MKDLYLYRDVFQSGAGDVPPGSAWAILPDLMRLADLQVKGGTAEAFAQELLISLRSLPAFAAVDRVSVNQLAPGTNLLYVLGAANGPGIENPRIVNGYHCFIADTGSLTQVQEGRARIYRDTHEVLQSFQARGRPPQRTIRLIHEMGHRSGICLPMELHGGKGFLFLNSFQPGLFDLLYEDARATLALAALIARAHIRPNHGGLTVAHRAAMPVTWDSFVEPLQTEANQRFGPGIRYRLSVPAAVAARTFLWCPHVAVESLLAATAILLGGQLRNLDLRITPRWADGQRLELLLQSDQGDLGVDALGQGLLTQALLPWDITTTRTLPGQFGLSFPVDEDFYLDRANGVAYSV